MNEKLIDNVIQDYSLRELQMHSSRILSNYNATNLFIKQFKADYDSQQFYKNVIKWYMKKYRVFPEDKLQSFTFKFLGNDTGLGDRFIMVSNILYTMKDLNVYNRFIVEIYSKKRTLVRTWRNPDPAQWFNLTDFYEVIDFFHFERPSTQVPIISNVIEEVDVDRIKIVDSSLHGKKNIRAFKKRKNITGNVS